MKTPIVLVLSLVTVFACQKNHKTLIKKEPTEQTITIKEVSRVAIVETDHHLEIAKNKGQNVSQASKIYAQAKYAYEQGEYKKAQQLAVEARQAIEASTRKK